MIDSLRETAISSIDSLSPNFFPEFQNAIQSGDHIRIRDAITSGNYIMLLTSQVLFQEVLNSIMDDIRTYGDEELVEIFGDDVDKVRGIRTDDELLKNYLFSEFLGTGENTDNGRQTCIAKAVIAVAWAGGVVAAGAFDFAISMNVLIGLNYAIHAYTYINSTGNTGQTWMFFNLGVVNWLSSFTGTSSGTATTSSGTISASSSSGGGTSSYVAIYSFSGYDISLDRDYFEECTVRNWDPEKCDDNIIRGGRVAANLEFEMFVNEVAEELSLAN